MMLKEMYEAEEIVKEEAIKKIKELVNLFQIDQSELLSIFDNCGEDNGINDEPRSSESFDPFFDAW